MDSGDDGCLWWMVLVVVGRGGGSESRVDGKGVRRGEGTKKRQ